LPFGAQPGLPFLPTSQPPAQPVSVPGLPYAFPPPVPHVPGGLPPPPNGAGNPTAATVQLVTALAAQGIPIDKIASVIQMMGQNGGAIPPAAPPHMPQPTQTGYAPPPPMGGVAPGPAPWDAPRPDDSRDRAGYHDGMRSPNRHRGRSRSRSPSRWDDRGSPRSRGFDYGRPGSPGRSRQDDRGRRGQIPDYRQRSPHGRHGGDSPHEPSQEDKWVEYDNNMPSGSIKVYSRTLFVGGVT
jgi:protein NRD1